MILSFIICLIAGLSTLLGAIIIFFKKIDKNLVISRSLFFAAGVLISICFFDLSINGMTLLIKNYSLLGVFYFFILVLIGIILSHLFNKKTCKKSNDDLYNAGIFSLIVIIMHNIPEGILTFLSTNKDIKLGVSISLAIAFHNIPEGISIAIPIFYSTNNKVKAIIYTFVAGLSELLGAFIALIFIKYLNIDCLLGFLYPIIVGIMLFLSIEELIPNANIYSISNKRYILYGILFMAVLHFIT